MFSGSTAGGLQSGPTTGRIDIIPDGGLPQTDVADLTVDLAHLAASLASKADSTNTDAALALKASNAEVALKANSAEVDASLALKASNAEVALKANSAEVDAALALKASNAEVALKANSADMDVALALKANSTDMYLALALKASTAEVALKANSADTDAALALKASTSALNNGLNSKQDILTNNSLQISHVSGLQAALDDAGGTILPMGSSRSQKQTAFRLPSTQKVRF